MFFRDLSGSLFMPIVTLVMHFVGCLFAGWL